VRGKRRYVPERRGQVYGAAGVIAVDGSARNRQRRPHTAAAAAECAFQTYCFERRKWPHLIFGRDGEMVALTNGVEYSWPGERRANSVHDATYTLLQPIKRVA
jgi:hypothetical protein